ncbi:MAG: endonuclease MutS2 [Longimicrobiaceae bacterium]
MNSHALQVLEHREALDLVARFASSTLGAEAVRALTPSVDRGWIEPELRRVDEMLRFLQRDDRWGVPAVPDLRESLARLRIEGSVWDAPVLRDAGVLLASSRATHQAIRPAAEDFPLLALVAERLVELPRVEEAIDRAIDEQGEVRDDASPELQRLRREIRSIRSRIVERLAAYAASLPSQYQVADASVTVREGRYVIPIRREGMREVGGIVHGESGTGATLFVEPPLAVELMNRLRELEAAEVREVLRILRELTGKLRPHREELDAALDALVELDSLNARARYAVRVDGTLPALLLPGAQEYAVVQGRHPILLARAEAVVPFDLRIDPGERTLLISGPNTGGKTVLLKAIGLLSLLAQSGVIPPVGPGTRLPIFRDLFADIGDEQSIEASLSTFSAHLVNLRAALEGADHESLVLIDEIGSGTDPTEGGALAWAVLMELTRRSAFTVATTHLGQLKLLAGEEPRVVNASLQFDSDRLQPTYQLLKGLPGRSYGIAIARRLGLPPGVIEEAEHALPQGERDVAKLLLELEARERQLATATQALDARLREVTRTQEELERREERLRHREKEAERRARQQARDLLLRARGEVEAAIQEVRSSADQEKLEEAARAARRRVEEEAKRQRERAPRTPSTPPAPKRGEALPVEVGVRVRIESLGRTGRVIELRDGKAMVEAGGMRLLLPREDLTTLPPGDQETPQPQRRVPSGGGYVSVEVEARPEVDLRGLRTDELELELGRALDAALMSGLPTFRIIHGKGTGALRDRVVELIQRDRRIATFRPGERYEGGTGVTVVEFA